MASNYLRGFMKLHCEDSSNLDFIISCIEKAKYYITQEILVDLSFPSHILSSIGEILNITAKIYISTHQFPQPAIHILIPQLFGEISRQHALRKAEVLLLFHDSEEDLDLEVVGVLKQQIGDYDPLIIELTQLPIVQLREVQIEVNESILGKFSSVVLAGTFDHLHVGHKILLTTAALVSTKAIDIGIMSDDLFVHKECSEYIQPFGQRENAVREFFEYLAPYMHIETFAITDPIGPAGTTGHYDALVCTTEVASALEMINEERTTRGLKQLEKVEISLLNINDCKVSSTAIRRQINEKYGGMYLTLQKAFERTLERAHITGKQISKWWGIVSLQYMRPFRFYHTLAHIQQMLSELENTGHDPSIFLLLAIWFHDVIYYTDREGFPETRNNEIRSKDLYHEFILDNSLGDEFRQVEDYILATIDHGPLTDEFEEKLLLDLDLAILSVDLQGYLEYVEKIKQEYGHIPEVVFLNKRRKFMRELLGKEVIYYTDYFKTREGLARDNIAYELSL